MNESFYVIIVLLIIVAALFLGILIIKEK